MGIVYFQFLGLGFDFPHLHYPNPNWTGNALLISLPCGNVMLSQNCGDLKLNKQYLWESKYQSNKDLQYIFLSLVKDCFYFGKLIILRG